MPATGERAARVHMRCLACLASWETTPDVACAIGTHHVAATVVAVTMTDGSRWLVLDQPEPVQVAPL